MIHSEDHVLSILDEYFSREHHALRLGRGDDCAELAPDGGLAVSTDLFVEDVHFRRSYFRPEEVGHKALAVNISDLAAAGAVPLAFSMGLVLPAELPEEELRGIFSGMSALAARHDIPLAGGDISRGCKIAFCITVLGSPPCAGAAFLRRDPRPGELLFVVSPGEVCKLGLARRGLEQLEKNGSQARTAFPAAVEALLRPEPLLVAGVTLAAAASRRCQHLAMMDISDGLARDLPRFIGVHGAELDFEPETLHAELGEDAMRLVFSGGDDYLLLGALSEDALHLTLDLPSGCSLRSIGRVTAGPGIFYRGKALSELDFAAFDHFGADK